MFLTDGLVWIHFDTFQPGHLEPHKTLDIINDNPVQCASYLVQHLDAAKFWPVEQTIDVLSQRLEELENTVSTLQKQMASVSQSKENSIISDAPISNFNEKKGIKKDGLKFINLADVDDIAGKKPSHLRLPDGSILKIKAWKDILRECCKFALTHNSSIQIPYPDRVGKKVLLFNYEKPAKGISYITEEYNGKLLYIYVNYDSYNCVENSKYILKLVPKDILKNAPAIVIE